MLIFSTAATTLLLLVLPREPSLWKGVIVGMCIIGIIGLGLHLVLFEPGKARMVSR